VAVEPLIRNAGERRLAYAGTAGFALLVLVAAVLWAQQGLSVYVTHVLSAIADCL
jgi:hypothetical protein